MVQQLSVARRSGVMELVNHDVLKCLGTSLHEITGVVTLDRAEQVILLFWIMTANQQVAKVLVSQDSTE
jgi:hypothetical protein